MFDDLTTSGLSMFTQMADPDFITAIPDLLDQGRVAIQYEFQKS